MQASPYPIGPFLWQADAADGRGIFFEHGHRMVATTVGMLTIVLAIWLWRSDRRRWMRRLGFIALAAVIAQGLLGGATVIFMLPKPVSISHACLAQLFFSTTVLIALFTSAGWGREAEMVKDTGRLRCTCWRPPFRYACSRNWLSAPRPGTKRLACCRM
jgi:hypothetical protein